MHKIFRNKKLAASKFQNPRRPVGTESQMELSKIGKHYLADNICLLRLSNLKCGVKRKRAGSGVVNTFGSRH